MKKILTSISSIFLLLLVTASIASAQEDSSISSEDVSTQKVSVDDNLIIEKRNDGRVLPVEDVNDLTLNQLDGILREMKYSNEMIAEMPQPEKEYVVSQGGVAVPVKTELKRYFRTSDGQRILITEENMNEVETLRQQEITKINTELNSDLKIAPLAAGSVSDGSFSGSGSLSYIGKSPNAKEFEFSFRDNFSFSKNVSRKFTDKIAHAWQSHTTSIYNSGNWWSYVGDTRIQNILSTKNEGSLYGRSGSFSHNGTIGEIGGWLTDTVRIPVSQKGTTGKWVTRYSHPWTALTPSITIGPISISYSAFVGDEWEWENTFVIQGS
ncbi:hypothetical protein [Paenibacillus xylanexedens]|uniref:hypothetical protein n=1 Tax=Paenibacillus xylanexedens TaxID=528191 RepID=UPI003B02BA3E